MNRIFLDNNSTTALDLKVFKEMLLDLQGPPANPSSTHWFGQRARNLLNEARSSVASFFHFKPEEVIFTSGGTESLNLLLKGLGKKGHLITTEIEHSAVYQTVKELEKGGLSATYLPVNLWGAPLPEQIEEAIQPDTLAIMLSLANSETGVTIDLESVASVAEKKGIPLFLDAVGFIGKEHYIPHPAISALAISGHKFHGPKGIGALLVRKPLKIYPQLTGGMQESARRSGTENLSGILGLKAALEILQVEQEKITEKLRDLRNHFEYILKKELSDLAVNGEGPRISNTSNLAFLGVDGETLLIQLDRMGIAASHGSACSSGALEPSRILTKMGVGYKTARSSLRFSLSRMNTKEEIDQAAETICHLVKKLRK